MKRNFTFFFAFIFFAFLSLRMPAQCFEPFLPGMGIHAMEDAPLLCSVWELDGYCAYTFPTYPGPCPLAFCGSCENYHWFGFMATSETIELAIYPSNCTGTETGAGLQAEVYEKLENGSFNPVSNCWSPGQVEDFGQLTMTGLEPGEVYYLMIDGWAGDVCDYSIEVLSAGPPFSDDLDGPEEIMGDTVSMAGSFASYSVDTIYGISTFEWSILPPEAGAIVQGQGENEILVNWQQSGEAFLCVESSNACSVTGKICLNLSINEGLTVSYGGEAPECSTGEDGFAWVEVMSGTPPFTYLWSTGDSSAVVENLPQGNYQVTVTDSTGLEIVANVELQTANALSLSLQSDCENFDFLEGVVQGGTPPYTYAWNTGSSEPVLENPEEGNYVLTVTDAQGCQTEESFYVSPFVFEPFEAALAESVPPVICLGEPLYLSAVDVAGPVYYLWTFGAASDIPFSNAPVLSVTPQEAGLFPIHLEVERLDCIKTMDLYVQVTDDPSWCLTNPPVPEPGPSTGGDYFGGAGDEVAFYGDSSDKNAGEAMREGFRLSPNPASDELELTFASALEREAELRIYAADGRLMTELHLPKGTESRHIRVRNWPAGLYRLDLKDERAVLLSKTFVVQKQ